MKKTEIKESVRQMRFEEIYERFRRKRLTTEEAADLLGTSSRTFLRLRRRYEEEGMEGLWDKRLGKASPHRAADEEVRRITKLYADRYRGFNVKHFHEFAQREHALRYGYTWTKNQLERAGFVKRSKRGGDHRLRRERRPMGGMMLHQDGSTHRWIEGLGYSVDLIVTMDDATSEITSAFFVLQEGTESTLRGLQETIEKKGLFCSLYTDRGSHYAYTPEARGKVDKNTPTQVGRALKQLGIHHVFAYSPQARGRSERLFGTLQGRLPQELALEGIETLEEANRYLREVYLPRHNEQFTVKAKEEKSAYIPWTGGELKEILCLQEERMVQNDNTIHYKGKRLQIGKDDLRHHYVRTTVQVREYLDGSLSIYYGPRCIGRYSKEGEETFGNSLRTEEEGLLAPALCMSALASHPHIGQLSC